MFSKLIRRIVKAFLFIFLLGFSSVLEKTNRAASLQDLGVENAFSVAQPIYSWILGFPLLFFLIYSKWADKNIWIRSNRDSIDNPNSNVKSNENPIKRMETIDKDKCQCGSIIQDKAKFCSECGEQIIRKPKIHLCDCGQEINPNAKFCDNCGLKISVQSSKKATKQLKQIVQIEDTNSSYKIESAPADINENDNDEEVISKSIVFIICAIVALIILFAFLSNP